MRLIDLSRDIEHKMQRLPNHPMVSISYFTTHEEKREADGYMFSSAVTLLNMAYEVFGVEISPLVLFGEASTVASMAEWIEKRKAADGASNQLSVTGMLCRQYNFAARPVRNSTCTGLCSISSADRAL